LYIFWVLGVKYFLFFLPVLSWLYADIHSSLYLQCRQLWVIEFFFFFLSSEWWIFLPRSVPICISCRESYHLKLDFFISNNAAMPITPFWQGTRR
jgi:hypothetical protein